MGIFSCSELTSTFLYFVLVLCVVQLEFDKTHLCNDFAVSDVFADSHHGKSTGKEGVQTTFGTVSGCRFQWTGALHNCHCFEDIFV